MSVSVCGMFECVGGVCVSVWVVCVCARECVSVCGVCECVGGVCVCVVCVSVWVVCVCV